MENHILKAQNITKKFPGTTALNDVTVSFDSGKVHAVLGKNGSGKSTLMKIFSGLYQATEGKIFLDGKVLNLGTTEAAIKQGIVTVYQELSVIKDLTIAENLTIGKMPLKKGGRIDWKKVYEESRKVLKYLQIDLEPEMYVRDLTVGQQQLVEIAKVMITTPRVLILDEPTSALSDKECQNLFRVMDDLRKKNIIILFITHRLEEVFEIADTVTVLRDSKFIGTEKTENLDASSLIKMMFGNVKQKKKLQSYVQDETVLEIKNFCNEKLKDVSFLLKKGEIIGLAGVLGSGRTEIMRAIYGLDRVQSGEMFVYGKRVKKWNPEKMRAMHCGFTSENRKEEGLCQQLSIGENLVLANLNEISVHKKIIRKKEEEYITRQIEDLHIKLSDYFAPVSSLSGGNQQKVVVGNWLNTKPKILLMDEPSRGIDVNAKQQIFQVMWEIASQGVSIIMVSSELEELLEVCDRILIVRNGRIRAEKKVSDMDIESIYSYCMQEES